MDEKSPREFLADLIAKRGENYGALSRLLGRNAAYIQQYIKRGTPRKLDETDRRTLARYFGVDEALLGGPDPHDLHGKAREGGDRAIASVPRLMLAASAGAGALTGEEFRNGTVGFDRRWLRSLGLAPENLSIIAVQGVSMSPTLNNGDTIMVDRGDGAERLRDGIYVLRLDDALMVKRVSLAPGRGLNVLTVSSDNPHYPSWENVDRSLVDIVGRVVWSSRLIP